MDNLLKRTLTVNKITVIPTQPSVQYWENSINNVILLKQYIKSVPPIFDALVGVKSNILKQVSEVDDLLLQTSSIKANSMQVVRTRED